VTTGYTLEGANVLKEVAGEDTIWYDYDAAGNILAMTLNGTTYYYEKNVQGDVIGIIDDTGTKVVSYVYDSWGKIISTTGSMASTVGVKNPYRYRGYRYDSETGLYYLQSRYYDADMRRFVNADFQLNPEVMGKNLFSYCENNPIVNEDSLGTKSYKFKLSRIKLSNLQGTYKGKTRCWEGIASLILTGGLVSYSFIGMGITGLKIAIAGTIATITLSSFVTVPLGVMSFLSVVGGAIYATYMASVIITAISYTNKYGKYKLSKAWKRSIFTYTISRA
jgi:RHS repeat-associated protein